ncbi:Phospholipase D/Transphosphatidylase domain-containing protein [Aphelenchoides bicaudatus]|nr:Phospholipase D/Transphosphatidylase domain-containing protein [Aphelenchoides bicaudatus]
MSLAQKKVYITAFYWSLLANDTGDGFKWDDSAITGKEVYEQLLGLAKKNISIEINQDTSTSTIGKYPYFEILHTKAWIIDDKHLYLGSANHDWRSLTQVKELGIAVYDCPCLADDLRKIFDVYAKMGQPESKLPDVWPKEYATAYNSQNPMNLRLNNEALSVYFTSSPPGFVPQGREHDGDSIVRVIDQANEIVYISVMDYAPVTLYQKPANTYWPNIDNAIRHAAFDRRAHVRLLMSNWKSTRPELFSYLHSLRALNSQLPCIEYREDGKFKCKKNTKGSIEIKLFEVPPYKVVIPFARVNHAKYMVTEKAAVICTSNWSADYFITTGGISMVVHATDSSDSAKLIKDMQQLHERDWNSTYATSIDEFTEDGQRINQTLLY